MKGYISSFESMGLVDGPGIRFVVFMQGCQLRCKYCHNPETWAEGGKVIAFEPREVVEKAKRFKSYFGRTGGITFSGGEPLMQPQFLLECLKLCKNEGINTCLDTAGVGLGDYDEILKYVDLVIMDIKAVEPKDYLELTGKEIGISLNFIDACQKAGVKLWLRQVIVPGLNDTVENVVALKKFASNLKNVEKIELLPYKTLGVQKYAQLGLKYQLDGVPDMDEEKLKNLQEILEN